MKRLLLLMLTIIYLGIPFATCENSNWAAAPTITKAYEVSSGKLFLEWEGNAPLYQINIDGTDVASVIVNSAVVPIKKGTHSVSVYPLNNISNADTNVNVGMGLKVFEGNINIDLAALGLDAKNLVAGTPSQALSLDYAEDSIFSATPNEIAFETDFDNRVAISFADPYFSDEYIITIKNRNNSSYVRYTVSSEQANSFIIRNDSMVSIILDPAYLQQQGCIVPTLGNKYSFTVQFRKNALDYITHEKTSAVFHESKESKKHEYTPIAAWKTAPEITYASQTSDGEITIKWTHDDNALGCEYSVMKSNKTLVFSSGKEKLLSTSGREAIISDLLNEKYTLYIIPSYNGEEGNPSESVEVKVENSWVVAPNVECEQTDSKEVTLSWDASEGVESYHIVVYEGNNKSLLQYINMDYKKYDEYDIPATPGTMLYVFKYDRDFDQDSGKRLKFEVYGVHIATNGDTQKSSSSTCSITIN